MPRQQLIDYHTDIGPSVDVIDAHLCSVSNVPACRLAHGLKQIAHRGLQLIFWLSVNRLCEVFANRFGVTLNYVRYGAHF